ncbi:serine hydrolase domain-containing protein [Rufibacter tibetensis]|uniref:Serine hydrolase n=1 Tax=Rufibacter tibetensis TaxID=512763 RepID=A0A0P0CQF9_9BACT|nr:serine hydrolase domain-containing protein [Rufibacter tibetensis]ALI98659.1 serine hydrolase [Rufibacter tibetensis]
MNKILYALLFIFLIASSFQQPPTGKKDKKAPAIINSSAKARVDATLKSFVDSGKIAGVSALIFEKNKEVYHNAFGYADREAKAKMDRNTIVRIYSMTKPVTGVALMKLYEKGAFQLDDPLSKFIPEFADMKVYKGLDASGNLILEPLKRPITVRDITRHTAGFATTTDLPGIRDVLQKADLSNPNNTLEQMVKKLASLPLLFQPGEQWSYGPSVDVQAYLVERLSGKPFAQYLQENIFTPLGMTNTRYVVAPGDRKRFAATYRKSVEGQLARIPDADNLFNTKEFALTPGGWGLTSTLDDYMKFARMLVNEGTLGKAKILKPETIKLMATNHLSDSVTQRMWLPSKGQVGFGIDFAVRLHPPATKEENNGVVGEFFWDGAASTLFWVDPVNDLTAVLFVQVFPFDGKLHKSFRDAVYGPFMPN